MIMKLVIQKVKNASVSVGGELINAIETGLMILVGVDSEDERSDVEWCVPKVAKMRIFDDENQVMNLSLMDVSGDVLAISQFTLLASTKKGNRPSYIRAARPEKGEELYNYFVELLSKEIGKEVLKGVFGAYMDVALVNDGPCTIVVDTKNRE